jgi:hypothetical protein
MLLDGGIIDVTPEGFGFAFCYRPCPQRLGGLTTEITDERLIFAEALQHLQSRIVHGMIPLSGVIDGIATTRIRVSCLFIP